MPVTTKDDDLNDIRAERAMLAVCYQNDLADVLMKLDRQDFVDPLHIIILCELKNMHVSGLPFDPVAVARWFRQRRVILRGKAEKINDIAYLAADVLSEFSSVENMEFYFRVLRQERLRRAIYWVAVEAIKRNRESARKPEETIEWAQLAFGELMAKSKVEPLTGDTNGQGKENRRNEPEAEGKSVREEAGQHCQG